MDDLQYGNKEKDEGRIWQVLNLVINGWPSIPQIDDVNLVGIGIKF